MPNKATQKLELRGYVYIDKMQPQYSALTGKRAKGDVPLEGMAQLFIELAPAIEVFRAMDIALKATQVKSGFLIAERTYGTLEIHSFSHTDVKLAGELILDRYGLKKGDQLRPEVISSCIITKLDSSEAQLIAPLPNLSSLIAGKSLFLMEVRPACFAILACNEAEKGADITVVDLRWTGRTGRFYVSGSETDVIVARDNSMEALNKIKGR